MRDESVARLPKNFLLGVAIIISIDYFSFLFFSISSELRNESESLKVLRLNYIFNYKQQVILL